MYTNYKSSTIKLVSQVQHEVNFAFISDQWSIYEKGWTLITISKAVSRIKKKNKQIKLYCVMCFVPKTAYLVAVVSVDVETLLYCCCCYLTNVVVYS